MYLVTCDVVREVLDACDMHDVADVFSFWSVLDDSVVSNVCCVRVFFIFDDCEVYDVEMSLLTEKFMTQAALSVTKQSVQFSESIFWIRLINNA